MSILLKDCNGNAKQVINSFTHGLIEVCEGQSLDTDFEIRKNVSLSEYINNDQKENCCNGRNVLQNWSISW